MVVSKLKNTSVKYNTELTHSVIEDLYDGFVLGLQVFEVAEYAGITFEQLNDWIEAGEIELARSSHEPEFQTGIQGLLAQTVHHARLAFVTGNLQILKECTEGDECEPGLFLSMAYSAGSRDHQARQATELRRDGIT